MDLACQGNKLVETPNIDQLANAGMRFTDAYAAAPVCSLATHPTKDPDGPRLDARTDGGE